MRAISPISNHSVNSKERLQDLLRQEYNKDEEARNNMPILLAQMHSGNLSNDPVRREQVSQILDRAVNPVINTSYKPMNGFKSAKSDHGGRSSTVGFTDDKLPEIPRVDTYTRSRSKSPLVSNYQGSALRTGGRPSRLSGDRDALSSNGDLNAS